MFILLTNLLVAVHGNGTRSGSSSYRDTLEEKILGLNQQLRVLQEEKRHFKMKLKKQQQHQSEQGRKRKVITARIPPIEEEEEEEDPVESTTVSLEETLSKLELEYKQSLQAKHDLERLHNEYTKKMKSLEQRCKSSTIQYQTIEEEYLNQILKLEQDMLQNSQNTTLTEADSEWLQQRIKEVQQQAILDFWNTIGNTKLTEVEHDMQRQQHLLLDKERQKSVATIQRLRHRQRSLAKTMAVREYQLHQHLQQIENEKKRKRQQEEEDLLILTAEQEEEERMKRIQQAKDDAEKERQPRQQRQKEEEKRKKEIEQSPSATSSSSFLTRIIPTNFLSKSSKGPPPSPTTTKRYVPSIENWNQRRVPWQPISIPPNDVLRRTSTSSPPTTTTTTTM
jgi:hypothetical protein